MSASPNALPRPPSASRKASGATLIGAVLSALLASACCLGPLLFALLGLSGAGLLVKLEAFRPYFTVATLAALGAGFWFTYRKPRAAEGDDCGCAHPRSSRAGRILLWVATALVIGLWSFPYLAGKFLD